MQTISKNQLILGLATGIMVLVIMILLSGKNDKIVTVASEDTKTSEFQSFNNDNNEDAINNLTFDLQSMRNDQSNQKDEFGKLISKVKLLEQNQNSMPLGNDDTALAALDSEQYDDKAGAVIEQDEPFIRPDILIENGMGAEDIDPNWSASASNSLTDMFTSGNEELQGVSMTNVECRTTICRVELAFDSVDGMKGTRLVMSNIPWQAEGFFKVNTDEDNPSAVLYLSRENHQLPRDIASQ